jgi:hypothetical protein
MRKSLGGGLGTLLVLGLGMSLLRNTVAPGGQSGTPKAESSKAEPELSHPGRSKNLATLPCSKPTCPEADLIGVIENSASAEKPADEKELLKEASDLATEFANLDGSNKFAIALVPDPVHTHLSLFFDRTIDAIQQGAQQARWIFDRATMPWDSEAHPESRDFLMRALQKKYQADQEDWPGLMIFRQANEETVSDTLLYVFVVGETPTGGVNKNQFRTAAKLVKEAGKSPGPLRIIGPTFSGSLHSLAQLIENQPPLAKFSHIVIRSGTVSSWRAASWFQSQPWSTKDLAIDFATFQQSDRYMLRKFIEFEKHRGYIPGKIAVLTEDETAYGGASNRPVAREASSTLPSSCPNGVKAEEPSSTLDEFSLAEDEDCVLRLYFPRDISQLRSAYQQGFEQRVSPSSDSYQIHATLPLTMQDTGSDDDSVQQYAHSETPLSQESILLGIVAAIRENDIQFVVLKATNPMDAVFLSAFLKKGDSGARVVAMPADLLLSRDADDVSLLHGVMALTTYSLLPGLADEVAIPAATKDERIGHVFPNAYSAGTYNATLSQTACLESKGSMDLACNDPSVGLPEARYAEYGWPAIGGQKQGKTNPLAPVVWLTVLGRNGFWPVAILDNGDNQEGDIPASPRPIYPSVRPCEGQYPSHQQCCASKAHEFNPTRRTFSGIASGVVLALVALYLVLLWRGSILATTSSTTVLAPIPDRCRAGLIVLMGELLLAALLLLAWPWVAWWKLGILPKVCVIVTAVAVALLCAVCVQQLIRRKSAWNCLIFLGVTFVLIACFGWLYTRPGHQANPFLYRYIHITSGVSPLLPLLCLLAAGLWWAWLSISGLALVDQRRPQLPREGAVSESMVKKLVQVLRPCAWDSRIYIPIFILFAIALCAIDYRHPLLSLEAEHFEWVYFFSLAVVVFVLFGAMFRLAVIWLDCRRVLTGIDRLPIRRAFAKLNFTWEPFWRIGGARWQDLYRLTSRQLESLQHLRNEILDEDDISAPDERAVGTLVRRIDETNRLQEELHQKYMAVSAEGSLHPMAKEPLRSVYLIESYQQLQCAIAETCGHVLAYLQPKWRGEEGLILSEIGGGAEGNKSAEDGDGETKLSLCTRLAERFVALVYLNFVLNVVLRMRTLTITIGGLYVFLLFSVDCYPFEPRAGLRSAAIFMIVFVVSIVGYVSAQVHRDSILSLVTQTKPGELGVEFWLRMGTFVALPLLSLLVSQFPSLNNAVFSWLEPAANALK